MTATSAFHLPIDSRSDRGARAYPTPSKTPASPMRYGSLFRIDDFSTAGTASRLELVALSGGRAGAAYDEKWLQRLLASHPQALPIAEIESFLEGAVPICLELGTNAGPIDLVLVTPRGDIVLVECKLWRNPQARREVVGQIIDYAKELPRLSYEAFDAAIRKAEPAGNAAKTDSLYQRAGAEVARRLDRGQLHRRSQSQPAAWPAAVADRRRRHPGGCSEHCRLPAAARRHALHAGAGGGCYLQVAPGGLSGAASGAGQDTDGAAWRGFHRR